MARKFDITCPRCGKTFHVLERPTGYAGGKDSEDIDCPWCGETVEKKMTDGWFSPSK
jgi:endogenous inhibitor of DNA gyrase (YacG/DUF329 family)